MDNLIKQIITDLKNGLDKKDVLNYQYGLSSNINETICSKGLIVVSAKSEDVESQETGVIDRGTFTIEIILAKKIMLINNAQVESADQFLVRLMSNSDTNCIRYIVRNHMRNYGIRQPSIRITYNDNRIPLGDVVTATMELTQEILTNQPVI